MDVPHRHNIRRMPQQLLNSDDRNPVGRKPRGERMPKVMESDII
jgi:hypothetical protein